MQRRSVKFLYLPGETAEARIHELQPLFVGWGITTGAHADVLWVLDGLLAKRITQTRHFLLVYDKIFPELPDMRYESLLREAGRMILDRTAHLIVRGNEAEDNIPCEGVAWDLAQAIKERM